MKSKILQHKNLCAIEIAVDWHEWWLLIDVQTSHSIGLMWWLLTREVLRLRGSISRDVPWEIMVDLYFYRDPNEEVVILACCSP